MAVLNPPEGTDRCDTLKNVPETDNHQVLITQTLVEQDMTARTTQRPGKTFHSPISEETD